MLTLEHEQIRPFDVDNCLVMHDLGDSADIIKVENPYSDETILLRPNRNMIRILKEEYARGGTILVWSRGGYKWAKAVVLALNLEQYVTLTMSKPVVYFDDTLVADWLMDKVFIGPDAKYKQVNEQTS